MGLFDIAKNKLKEIIIEKLQDDDIKNTSGENVEVDKEVETNYEKKRFDNLNKIKQRIMYNFYELTKDIIETDYINNRQYSSIEVKKADLIPSDIQINMSEVETEMLKGANKALSELKIGFKHIQASPSYKGYGISIEWY